MIELGNDLLEFHAYGPGGHSTNTSGEDYMKQSVIQEWVSDLPLMQQTVLLSAIRGCDGIPKKHKAKELIKWYRRCVLKSAWSKGVLHHPETPEGGSFMGPVNDIVKAANDFVDSRDELHFHYQLHVLHAIEILGYKHPRNHIRKFWDQTYCRLVSAYHLDPESERDLDNRLGDNMENWEEKSDPSTTCSD